MGQDYSRLDLYRETGRWLSKNEAGSAVEKVRKLKESNGHLQSSNALLMTVAPGACVDCTFELEVRRAAIQLLKKHGIIRYRKSYRMWEIL